MPLQPDPLIAGSAVGLINHIVTKDTKRIHRDGQDGRQLRIEGSSELRADQIADPILSILSIPVNSVSAPSASPR
jgi:hypothetical protein